MSKMKNASIEFTMDGQRYSANIPAESRADAERRLAAIRATGKLNGWPCYSIKLPSPLMYLAMPFLWVGFHIFAFFAPRPKQ